MRSSSRCTQSPVLYGGSVKPDNASVAPRRCRTWTALSSAVPRSTSRRSRRSVAPAPTLCETCRPRHPRRLGIAPPRGPGTRSSSPTHACLRLPLGARTRTGPLAASGEAVGSSRGPDGQLGGRAPHDRLRPDPVPGSRAREPTLSRTARSPRTRRSSRRSGARASAAATSTCSGSSRTAASTRTSTTSVRSSPWPSARAWRIGPGCTRSRTAAMCRPTRRRAISPSSRPSASRPSAAATTRWIATAAGSGRIEPSQRSSRASGRRATDPVRAIRASYERGVTDEFVEPVVLDGRPRLTARDAAIFFNFRPDRARQLSQRLLEAGIDLTTMTRYRDDFPFPVAFDEQEVRKHARRGARGARAPPAPRRGDGEVRTRHVLLQRRRGDASGRGRRGSSSRRRATCRATT